MADLATDLAAARRERTPVMALRPDSQDHDLLDDIVVKDVEMFRAEALDDDVWWLACYFANGEQVTFHVTAQARPKRIKFSVTEKPSEWIDFDARPTPEVAQSSDSEGGSHG